MNWYVLRQRRHDGPFSVVELQTELDSGRLSRADFLLSEADFESGKLNYVKIAEVLNLPPVQTTTAKKADAPRIKPEDLLKVVGDLDAGDIIGAQNRVREDQGRVRDDGRGDAAQVLLVQKSQPSKSPFRFDVGPTLAIVFFATLGIVATSAWFLSKSQAAKEGLEITASHEVQPKAKRSTGRRPAQARPEREERIMPSNRRERNNRDRAADEEAREPERDDYDRDIERIDKGSRPSELDKLKRRRRGENTIADPLSPEPGGLDGMDVDLRERDRRPGAYDEREEEEVDDQNEESAPQRQDDGNDDGDPENPRYVE